MAGSRTLTFDITTDGQKAVAGLKKVQQQLEQTGNAATATGKKAATAGDEFNKRIRQASVLAGGLFAFKEASQAQQTAARTAAVIKSTGNAAQVSAKQQDQFVQALSKQVAVDDEVIAGGANILRTFKAIQGPEAFEGALTAAEDLSAALGTDLQAASLQVGKALQDPVKGLTSLRRAGVSFTDQQREQIKAMVAAGNTAGAQRKILAELNSEFGGSAKAMATDGAKIHVALSNVAETAGGALLPIAAIIGDVAQGFSELPGPVQTGAIAIGGMGLAVSKLSGALGEGGLRGALTANVSDLGAFNTGLLATGVGLTSFSTTLKFLNDKVKFHGDMGALTADLEQLGTGAADSQAVFDHFGGSLESFNKKYEEVDFNLFENNYGANGAKQAKNDLLALDEALASLAGTNPEAARAAVGKLTVALESQGQTAGQVAAFLPKYYDALHRAGRAAKQAADDTEYGTTALDRYKKKLDESTDALKKHTAAGQATFDAQQGLDSANADVASSLTDMAAAQADVNGTSDEAVAASQAITDAQKDEADARRDVVDLQLAATEAQQDLNKERQDAVKRLDDLSEATKKAAMSQRDATLALHEAQNENRRTFADPRATALDREKAAVGLADAQDNATSAAKEHAKAIEDENTAKAKGVEGDDQVVAAKKKVADAQQAIVDGEGKVNEAHRKVSEAVRARSKFEEAAILKVRDAHDKVNTALENRVVANAKVIESQYGVVAGDIALRDGLKELSDLLEPGSTLSNNTIAWAESVAAALRGFDSRRGSTGEVTGLTRPQSFGETPRTQTTATPPTRNPDVGPRNIVQNITVNGEPTTKQKREAKALARQGLGEIVRAAG